MSAAGSDSFAGAPPIAIGDTSAPTVATTFTFESGETVPSGFSGSVYRSAWWKITPTADGWIRLDTELSGSGNDTVIGVFADVTGTLVEVASDDDSGGPFRTSLLDFYGYAAFTYYVQVTNYEDTAPVSYTLRCTTGSGGTPPPPPALPPTDYNNFADAQPIAIGATDTVNATSFTLETGERMPTGYSFLFRSAWWYIEPTANGWVQADTELGGDGNDTVIGVWADISGTLVEIGNDDDSGSVYRTSLITFYAYAGFRYYLQLLHYNETGALSYVLRTATGSSTDPIPPPPALPGPPPDNDNRADAVEITVGGSDTIDATSATTETDEPSPGGWTPNRTVWWYLDPVADGWATVDGALSASIGSPELLIAVWVETAPGVLRGQQIAFAPADSETASLTFYAYAGSRYLVQVGSTTFATTPVSYTLGLTASASTGVPPARPDAPAPTNDHFADAETIAMSSTASAKTSSNATTEPGEPGGNRSVWFKYVATETGTIGMDTLLTPRVGDTAAQSDTTIFVYTGSSLGSLTGIANGYGNYGMSSSGLSAVDVPVTAGTTYYVRIYSGDQALDMDYVLRVGPSFHTTLGWQGGDEITAVWNNTGYHHSQSGDGTVPWEDGYRYTAGGAASSVNGYHGGRSLSRALGGVHPGVDADGYTCCWTHARRYVSSGVHYWSLNGCPTWNCTDPYNPAIPGHGDCAPMPTTSPISEYNGTFGGSDTVGYRYTYVNQSSGLGIGLQVSFDVYAEVRTIGLHNLAHQLRTMAPTLDEQAEANAYRDALIAAGWTDVVLTWESDEEFDPQLLSLEIAPDQPTNPTDAISGNGAAIGVEWYLHQYTDADKVPSGSTHSGWGPYLGYSIEGPSSGIPGYANVDSRVTGDADGPESWTSGADLMLSYSGGTSDFVALDEEMLADAWAWEEVQPQSIYQLEDSPWPGLVLVGMPTGALSDSPPSAIGPYGTMLPNTTVTTSAYRTNQAIAMRLTYTSRRYRVTAVAPSDLALGVLKVKVDAAGATEIDRWQTWGFPNETDGAGKVFASDGWHVADDDAATVSGHLKIRVDASSWADVSWMTPE